MTLFEAHNLESLSSSLPQDQQEALLDFHEQYCWLPPYEQDGHLLMLCQAAFPMVLTPDLLYQIRLNFQADRGSRDPLFDIPYEAVSDILLSPLVRPTGGGQYEMLPELRDVLLQLLLAHPRLGKKRMNALAHFLDTYAERKLNQRHQKRLQQVQRWTAQAVLEPQKLQQELMEAISRSDREPSRKAELAYYTRMGSALAVSLQDYQQLVHYCKGMQAHLLGDEEEMAKHFSKLKVEQGKAVMEGGLRLKLPKSFFNSSQKEEKKFPKFLTPTPIVPFFVNRLEELRKLKSRLNSGKLLFLTGPAGIGKTALATLFAINTNIDEYSRDSLSDYDHVIWLNINPALDAKDDGELESFNHPRLVENLPFNEEKIKGLSPKAATLKILSAIQQIKGKLLLVLDYQSGKPSDWIKGQMQKNSHNWHSLFISRIDPISFSEISRNVYLNTFGTIKNFLAKGNIEKAISYFKDYDIDTETAESLFLIEGRFNSLRNKEIKAVLTNDEKEVESNQIISTLIDLVEAARVNEQKRITKIETKKGGIRVTDKNKLENYPYLKLKKLGEKESEKLFGLVTGLKDLTPDNFQDLEKYHEGNPGMIVWAANLFKKGTYSSFDDFLQSLEHQSYLQNFSPTPIIDIEGGSFLMGSKEDDSEARNNEKPQHQITLDNFSLEGHPVTVRQYLAFAYETDSHYPEWLEEGSQYHYQTGSNDYYKKLGEALTQPDHPIVGISWHDAQAYAQWLSKRTGHNYRLPTEAEWEYAARGGKESQGFTYAGSNELEEVGWYNKNADGKTHPVKTKAPNELGLFDMSGNVWEWCADWYRDYDKKEQHNPTGPESGDRRVIRGGSWDYDASNCRVAFRYDSRPVSRSDNVGFRLARS